VAKLLDILSRRDDSLLPLFYDGLDETGQTHVTNILRQNVLQQQQQQQQHHQQGEHVSVIIVYLHSVSFLGSSFILSSSVAVSQQDNWEQQVLRDVTYYYALAGISEIAQQF